MKGTDLSSDGRVCRIVFHHQEYPARAVVEEMPVLGEVSPFLAGLKSSVSS